MKAGGEAYDDDDEEGGGRGGGGIQQAGETRNPTCQGFWVGVVYSCAPIDTHDSLCKCIL